MEFKKHLSALMLASLLLAQVQLGNIRGFEPLVPETSAIAPTFTFNTAWEIRSFINTIPGITHIQETDPGSGSAKFDNQTALKICQLKGYRTVVSKTSDYYRSCGDNTIWYVDAGHPNGAIANACTFNSHIWTLTCSDPLTQCNDGVDNDNDGKIDAQDAQCHTDGNPTNGSSYDPNRNNEAGTGASCSDGRDNDNDSKIDGADPDCHTDHNAGNPGSYNPNANEQPTQCSDGVDNDNDGKVDAADPQCHTDGNAGNAQSYDFNRNNEAGTGATCSDGRDNDNDSKIDGADPDCHTDHDSGNPATYNPNLNEAPPQCSDNVDNDNDGVKDAADASCHSDLNPSNANSYQPTKNDEANPKTQCQDGIDNDGDAKIDAQDKGCHTDGNPGNPGSYNPQDNDEGPRDATTVAISASGPATLARQGNQTMAIQYQFTLRNTGTITAENLEFRTNFPLGAFVLNTANSTPGCHEENIGNGREVACPAGSLSPGATKPGLVGFDVPAGTDTACGRSFTLQDKVLADNATAAQGNNVTTTITCVQCSDGIDNDNDGAIDLADFSCQNNPNDNDEANPKTQCQDGIDNDNDGLKDSEDPGCSGPQDNTENSEPSPSVDLKINGQDGTVTVIAGTSVTLSWTSTGVQRCNTGTSNMPGWGSNQPLPVSGSVQVTASQTGTFGIQCSKTLTSNFVVQDSVAVAVTQPQCSDGTDNDNDGAIDGADASCHSDLNPSNPNSYQPTKNDESTPKTQCQDGIDNDGDGLTDLQDPGCSGKQDNSEKNPNGPQCDNGIDDDNDGKVDYPADPDCSGPTDTTETPDPTDLQLTVTGPGTGTRGQTISYVFVIKNNGPGIAQGVNLSIPVPAGLIYDSVNSEQTCQPGAGNTVQCPLGQLALNPPQRSLTVRFIVAPNAQCNSHPVILGTVTSTTTDPNLSNNSASPSLTISCTQCNDGIDNDSDGAVDIDDASCHSDLNATHDDSYLPSRNDESTPKTQCQDGIDNDNDHLIDSQDPACHTDGNANNPGSYNAQDNDESPANNPTVTLSSVNVNGCNVTVNYTKQFQTCVHMLTTQGNTILHSQNLFCNPTGPVTTPISNFIVPPFGPGLSVKLCNGNNYNECSQPVTVSGGGACVPLKQCQDGIDNDNDGAVDSADASCHSDLNASNANSYQPTKDDESTPKTQCQDGIDNDGDGLTDLQDPGCSGPQDNSEKNPNGPQCDNGIDDDNDSKIDYPADPGCTGPTDTTETDPVAQADLFIVKSGPQQVTRGNVASYTVTAYNLGPNTAQGVTINDPIPAGLTFNSQLSDADCVQNGNNILCDNTTLALNQSKTVNIVFNVPVVQNCTQTTVQNTATVSSSTTDPNSSNNQSQTVTTTVLCPTVTACNDGQDNDHDGLADLQDPGCNNNPNDPNEGDGPADLQISMTGPASVAGNQNATYTVIVKNNGPDAATTPFSFRDPIPSGVVFVPGASSQNCAVSGNDVVCSGITLAVNQQQTYTIVFNATVPVASVPTFFQRLFGVQSVLAATCGGSFQNQVFLTPVQPDSNTGNNQSSSITTTVTCQQPPQFTITKVTSNEVQANEVLTYIITATNTGNSAQNNIRIADLVPAGLTYTTNGSTAGCALQGTTVYCAPQTFQPGQSVAFTLKFTANANNQCDLDIVNTASIQQNSVTFGQSNQTHTHYYCTTPKLDINKSAPPISNLGGTVTYTYTLKNTSTTQTAQDVHVEDFNIDPQANHIPSQFTLLSSSLGNACTYDSVHDYVTCQIGNMTPNQLITFSITFSIPNNQALCGQTVINQVDAWPGSDILNADWDKAQTFIQCQAQSTDVQITKTAPSSLPNDSATPFNYTLTVKNNTSVAAANVIVTDTIPAGLSVTSATAGCNTNGNTVTCSLGTLAANATTILNIAVSAPARAYCAQTVSNTASVTTTTTETNTQNNTSTAQTGFTCSAQHAKLYITKDVAATTVAGQSVTYYYTLQNTSSFTANGVNVYDYYIDSNLTPIALPFTFVSATGINCHLDQANNRVACDPVDLTAGQMISFTMTFQTPSGQQVCNQAFTNRAESIVGTDQQTLDTDTAATVLQCPAPQFTAVKYADLQTVHPGDTITYTIVSTNAGSQSQQNVRIADSIPANMTFVSAGSTAGCAVQGVAVFCPAQTMTPGQTVTTTLKFQLSANAPCGSNYTVDNVADVQQNNTSVISSNHVQTPIVCVSAPQFTLTKIGPTVVSPGESMTYIITATNTGNTPQSGIAVYDDVPAGTTFDPSGSTAGCTLLVNHVYCASQTYQPGQSASFTLKFIANQNVPCDAIILNKAELAQNGNDFLYSNEVQTPVTCASPKLDITKSAPATSNAGGTVTYTFTLRNTNSTQIAYDVNTYDFFIDPQAVHVPSPFTFLSSSLGANACSYDAQMDRTVCHIGDMAPNQVVNFTMTYSIPDTQQICNQTVINQVDAWPGTDDANADWDKAQTVVQCAPQGADLSIVKTGPASANRGSNVVYTLTVNNAGPATATNVVTHDLIPQGMTFVSASGPASCSVVNNNTEVACTIGSVTAGAPVVLQLTFSTQPAQQSCVLSSVTNVASVTSSTTDPNNANNQSQTTTQLTCPQPSTADLTIVKTGPASVIRGNTATYTIVVANSGPATATGVTVTDTLPAGLENVQISGATCAVTGNNSQASCTIPSITAGSSVVLTLTALVPTIQNCTQTAMTNTASVTSVTTDPNAGNNQSLVVTSVTCPADTSADVGILKFGQTSVVRGSNVTYSLLATNYGPGTAQNITITDPLPQGFTFVSASGAACTSQNGSLSCTIASLPSGQSSPLITVTYSVPTIQNCTQTTVTNTATVATTSTDPNASNNQSSVQTAVVCQAPAYADLFVNKIGPQSAEYGTNVTYTVTATNAGPASASGVTVTDTIPLGLTYVSVSGATCALALPSDNNPTNNGFLSCDVGALATGLSKAFTLTFSTVAPQTCTQATVTNLVSISENDPNVSDPNASNNQSQATTNLTCAALNADVGISKTGPTSAQRGSTLTYTLTAVNNGPASASNVIIHDPFSSELTFTSASGATCSVVGSEVQCALGTMTSGQTVTATLTFAVKTVSGTCTQTSIQNTATITTGSTDPTSSNNTSQTITTTLTCSGGSISDISVYKTDNRSTVNVGESLRYSIILTNSSSQVVNSLLVTDPVPYGLTITTVSDGGAINGQQVRWTDISVPANSSRTLYIDAQVSSSLSNNTQLTNTVDVNGKQSTDQTTVVNNNNNNPPYYPPYTPPPYYPPYNPPVYNPPYNPPTYTPPPVYYPTQPPPPVVYPQTGTKDVDLYAKATETATLTKVQSEAPADNGFSAVFYGTLLAMFAAGSAFASRMLAGGF